MATTDYMRICASDWTWMALMRSGKQEHAAELLSSIHEGMDAGDAAVYYRRLRMYQGLIQPEALLDETEPASAEYAALLYGLGNFHFVHGRVQEAKATWKEAIQCEYWPSFGVVASATELSRLG